MFAPNLLPVIIGTIIILLYNPIMTVIFINQRFNLENNKFLGKRAIILLIFSIVLICQFIGGFLFEHDFDIWMFMYVPTITVLVIWDRIAKRINSVKHNR